MYLIAGLGNPGARYENTRHNAGFWALDFLSEEVSIPVKKIKFKGLVGEGVYRGEKLVLLKPQTYMNLSGESVLAASEYYSLPPEKIIVLSDDIALPEGSVRVRRKGSDGGHNGLRSIIYLLESDEFPRVKIGVGAKPKEYGDMKDWVVGSPSGEEKDLIRAAAKNAAAAALEIIFSSLEDAMGKYNRVSKKADGDEQKETV